MIERTRELVENVEYWRLSLDIAKGTAEIEFLRPGGGRVRMIVPLSHLTDLKRDLDAKFSSGLTNPQS